jgi:hypothetical protein
VYGLPPGAVWVRLVPGELALLRYDVDGGEIRNVGMRG